MLSASRKFSLPLIILIGTTLLLLGLQIAALYPGVTTPIERSEYSVRDVLMRIRGARPTSGDIVIVAIDDFSFNWTGYQWPWPRKYLAQIVDEINKGGAKVVGVDIFLFEPDPDPNGDRAFATALGEAPAAASVLQIFQNASQNLFTLRRPRSAYLDVLDGIGITSFSLDEDAIIRSVRAYDRYDDQVYYHWAFELAGLYLGAGKPSNPTSTELTFNGQSIPLRAGQMLINFSGPTGAKPSLYPTYSAHSVALGDVLAQDPDAFRGRIVLIGATTVTLQDLYPTPFSAQQRMPGVEVVANAVDTLIKGNFLRESPPWLALLLTLAAALAAAFITRSERPSQIITLLIGAMLIYGLICYFVFAQAGWLLPVSGPETMLFLGVVLPSLEQGISQELEKRRVRNLFNRFISPEMVAQLIATQDINSLNKRANLTILFSDIRGFTTMAEKLPPEEVVALLNSYLESMTAIVHKYGGTVDKYEGDALVAFFGEPVPYSDHAVRAARAAVEMQTELPGLTDTWIKEGRPINRFDVGIGLNSGDVFVGLIGSAQRINYTVIGDNAKEWSTDGVQVWQDTNKDVGGAAPAYTDEEPLFGDGFDRMVFGSGQEDDPDLAWARISPDEPNGVQLAVKRSLFGTDETYLAGMWAGNDALDPARFDFNDHMSHTEAGAAIRGLEVFYPIKGLAELDATCRVAIGFAATGNEPGLCKTVVPSATGCQPPPGGCPPSAPNWRGEPYCFCYWP